MMKVKNKPAPVKKVIWRMSGNAPLGEYVTGDEVAGASAASAEAGPGSSSWRLSSVELRDGIQISEQPLDTLPGELLDEFFKR
jgi:hypothetical protein